jgi:FAD/FMN-containing dehydrogenase
MDYLTYSIAAEQIGGSSPETSARDPGTTGAAGELPFEELELLRNHLVGHLVLPGHDSYEMDRKLFNTRFDPHPSVIVYCAVERDVGLCIDSVRIFKIPFSIRAGGNSFAGYSASDGMIIDVGGLNDVCVDSASLVATVGCGCSFGKLNSILYDRKLHLPLGDAKRVRTAGFMQGGGFGLTSRTFGMNSDSVLEVRVLLADGRIVRASETVNHDLWWAVRGGTGGNFGVLLNTRYRLRPAPEQNQWCLGWRLSQDYDLEHAVSALMTLQESFVDTNSSPEMNVSAAVVFLADRPNGPPQIPWLVMGGTYVGNEADMDALLEPLLSNPGCWPMFRPLFGARPQLNFDRCSRLISRSLTPEDWRSILSHFLANMPNFLSTLQIDLWGGAIGSYPRERSAFIHRDAAFNVGLTVWWQDQSEETASRSFQSSWIDLVMPFWNGHIYQNFPSADVPDYRSNYWGEAFPALLAVKQKYDPEGLFKFPQSIAPRDGKPESVNWPARVVEALRQPIQVSSDGSVVG